MTDADGAVRREPMTTRREGPVYDRTDVYLEDRYDQPKHMFVAVADRLAGVLDRSDTRLLDAGGATGEFGHYLRSRFPALDITCLDNDPELVAHGARRVDRLRFVHGDVNDMAMLRDGGFQAVTLLGVLTIFDDFAPALSECIRVATHEGTVVVVSQFNDFPIDALIRWRYSGEQGPYRSGYNLFSKESVSAFLHPHPRVASHEFEQFVLPFDLAPRSDPIRTWTERDAAGNRILRNGLLPEVNLQTLTIRLR